MYKKAKDVSRKLIIESEVLKDVLKDSLSRSILENAISVECHDNDIDFSLTNRGTAIISLDLEEEFALKKFCEAISIIHRVSDWKLNNLYVSSIAYYNFYDVVNSKGHKIIEDIDIISNTIDYLIHNFGYEMPEEEADLYEVTIAQNDNDNIIVSSTDRHPCPIGEKEENWIDVYNERISTMKAMINYEVETINNLLATIHSDIHLVFRKKS